MNRQELKQAWFNMDHSKTPVRKEIIVTMDKYKDRIGQGTVQILSDGPDGYSSFKTHQKVPVQYALDRIEESVGEYRDLTDHKLIIKQ